MWTDTGGFQRPDLLRLAWGKAKRGSNRQQGTIHEHWRVQWQPEFAVALVRQHHSRKACSEVVWRQTTENFIRCLENAFRHRSGCRRHA